MTPVLVTLGVPLVTLAGEKVTSDLGVLGTDPTWEAQGSILLRVEKIF